MRILDNNSHGNKNWAKKNNCINCANKFKTEQPYCSITNHKPLSKCNWFVGKSL